MLYNGVFCPGDNLNLLKNPYLHGMYLGAPFQEWPINTSTSPTHPRPARCWRASAEVTMTRIDSIQNV